jgi:hypothetical protein
MFLLENSLIRTDMFWERMVLNIFEAFQFSVYSPNPISLSFSTLSLD